MTRPLKTRIAWRLYRWVLKLDPNTELEYRAPNAPNLDHVTLAAAVNAEIGARVARAMSDNR